MTRARFAQVAIAAALVAAGWVIGRAQTASPDFELVVNAPVGETTIRCERGCKLVWVERGVGAAEPQPTFTFSCRNSADARCSSARVGGWIDTKK
jgi:hypothetical protein